MVQINLQVGLTRFVIEWPDAEDEDFLACQNAAITTHVLDTVGEGLSDRLSHIVISFPLGPASGVVKYAFLLQPLALPLRS